MAELTGKRFDAYDVGRELLSGIESLYINNLACEDQGKLVSF